MQGKMSYLRDEYKKRSQWIVSAGKTHVIEVAAAKTRIARTLR